jgi:hypothetical protein
MTPILPITPRAARVAKATATSGGVLALIAGALLLAASQPPPSTPALAPPLTSSVGATGCPGSRIGSTGGPLGGTRTTTTKEGR